MTRMNSSIRLVFCSLVLAVSIQQSQSKESKPERCPHPSMRPVMGVENGQLNGRCMHNEDGPPSCAEGLVCCSIGRKRRQGQREGEGNVDKEGRPERVHRGRKGDRPGPGEGPREGTRDGPREGPGKGPGERPQEGLQERPKEGPGGGPREGPGKGPRQGPGGKGPREGPGGKGPRDGPRDGPREGPGEGPREGQEGQGGQRMGGVCYDPSAVVE